MATLVLTDAYVVLNSVNLSDHVRQVTINYEAEMVDDTNMGDTARNKLPGLKNWTVDLEFAQDYGTGSVDATLFPLVGAAAFPIEIRPTSAAVSATNPKYTGNALLASYPPVSGAQGALATASVRLEGTGALTRATA